MCQSFKQNLVSRRAIEIFARAITHTGHDVGGPSHVAAGEYGNLGDGADQFGRPDGALGALRGHFDDDNFRARFLQLTDDGIRCRDLNPNMAEDLTSETGRLQEVL